MDAVLVRWLQDGDPGGLYRRAMTAFPDQKMTQRALDKYFIEGGKASDKPYRPLPMWVLEPPQGLDEMSVLGNFCEAFSTLNPKSKPSTLNFKP